MNRFLKFRPSRFLKPGRSFTALILLMLCCFHAPAFAALNDGLVAYWSFDDCTAKDNSGNGHDGTIIGNLECITGVDGKKAFHFKGAEYITTGYKQVNVTAYSVSAWVKIATTENGGGIAENRGSQYSGAKALSLVSMPPFGGYPYDTTFAVHGDLQGAGIILGKRSPKLLNDNVWHHLVGTWTATAGVTVTPSQFNLYIDGVKILEEVNNGVIFTSPLSGVGNMVIGRYEAWHNFFTGIIDNVRIYNRALTAAEVTALYKQGTTATINPIYNLFSKIADVALEDASGIPEDIYDAKINDALSSIPEMLAFLGKHPYFKNTPIVKNIGINATLQADLTDKLNFKKWKNPSNIKKMGKDWLIGKFIDHTSQAIGNATGSKKWEGVSWFIIKQMYSVGTAYSESKGNPAMFQINLLINQSGLLADVISKNIEELNILQNDFTGAKAAEIRNQIIQARSFQLLDRYQNYFRAATWKEKNAIRKDIELKQSDLLKRYLSGDADHIFVPRVSIIAKKIYAAWLKDLPGDLVKEELEYKANLSASVYKGEYDQAISAAKSIFGSSTFADDLIREKAKTDAGAMAYLVANGITP